MILGHGPAACIVLASVGAAWSRAVLPASLYDRLRFHLVEPSPGRSSVAAVTQHLAETAEDLEQPLVLGISMNGTLALAAAAMHPGVFGGVVAVTAPPQLPPDRNAGAADVHTIEPERQAEYDRRKAEAEAAPAGSDQEMRLWRRVDAVRRWHDWTFDPTDLDALAVMDRDWVTSVMADGAHHDWGDLMSAVACPVLLVLGRSDFVVPPTSWALDHLPPNFTAEILDHSGHTPPYEQPEEFALAVRRWLDRDGHS